MNDNVPMTPRGYELLKEELNQLKTVDRPANVRDIETALEHGDLSENAEYHAAKEQQGFIEGRISELEAHLSSAEIIDIRTLPGTGRVVFGTTVDLSNVETAEEVRYQIVGELEADISRGLVSVTSPIARALIGKEEGDVAVVLAPGGREIEYEILAVEFV